MTDIYKKIDDLVNTVERLNTSLRIFNDAYKSTKSSLYDEEIIKEISYEEYRKKVDGLFIKIEAIQRKKKEISETYDKLTSELVKLGKTQLKLANGNEVILEEQARAKIIFSNKN